MINKNTNSIAVIMKHVAENMISRWADFLATDGEKWNQLPTRSRLSVLEADQDRRLQLGWLVAMMAVNLQ